jgi:hypothetical protein
MVGFSAGYFSNHWLYTAIAIFTLELLNIIISDDTIMKPELRAPEKLKI